MERVFIPFTSPYGTSGVQVYVPNRFVLVSGIGDAAEALNAFDRALLSAGVGNYNLVKVTSILPPFAQVGSVEELPAGAIVFAAMGSITSLHAGEQISAAVAAGVPADPSKPGVLMEGSFRCSKEEAEQKVREMAKLAMQDRGEEILRIDSAAAGCEVKQISSAFAAVLLYRSQ